MEQLEEGQEKRLKKQQILKFIKCLAHLKVVIIQLETFPTKTINRVSINTARNSAANDYFDLFLMIVEDYYKLHKSEFIQKYASINQRKGVKNLANVMINVTYFELFPDFNSYISWNHLESFYQPGRFPLFDHSLERIHFNNIKDINFYLANAIDIIEERSDSLTEVLIRLLR